MMRDYITSREKTTAEHYLRWAVQNCSKRDYVKLPRDKVLEIAEYIESTRDEVESWSEVCAVWYKTYEQMEEGHFYACNHLEEMLKEWREANND